MHHKYIPEDLDWLSDARQMYWVNTSEREPPLATKVLAYFNFKDFKGYAVVSREKVAKSIEYQFDIPGENYGQEAAPIKWCLIKD